MHPAHLSQECPNIGYETSPTTLNAIDMVSEASKLRKPRPA